MKKLSVIRDIESPPGGWRYTVLETGTVITARYASQLRKLVARHADANGFEPPETADLDDAICRESGHGEPWCGGAAPRGIRALARFVTRSTVSRALKTVMQVLRDRDFVPPEEADRRLGICKTGNGGEPCPHLTDIGLGCRSGCSEEIREMEKILGKKNDGVEPVCGACGCLLRAKVRIANATLDKAEKGDRPDYWGKCWRHGDAPPPEGDGAP